MRESSRVFVGERVAGFYSTKTAQFEAIEDIALKEVIDWKIDDDQ